MSTLTAHLSPRAARRLAALVALVAAAAATSLSLPAGAPAARHAAPKSAYGWPVKPFDRQHPVRGFFGDPRVGLNLDGTTSRQFHFGVDVSAPNGTPVYATLTGRVSIHPEHDDVVFVDGSGGVEFSYWHIVPSVHTGDAAVAYKTVVGRIEAPWAHVHFSEMRNGVYLNPLRPGAMGPYSDPTRPAVSAVELERPADAAHVAPTAATGAFDVVAEVSDRTPIPVAAPWHDMPVMPALVRWRVVGMRGAVTSWQTAVDFRETIPPASDFSQVFAKWTRQNHPDHPGRYRVYLAHAWNSSQLPPGSYRIQVSACDSRDNTGVFDFPITLGSGR
jgi:hypothetical protein